MMVCVCREIWLETDSGSWLLRTCDESFAFIVDAFETRDNETMQCILSHGKPTNDNTTINNLQINIYFKVIYIYSSYINKQHKVKRKGFYLNYFYMMYFLKTKTLM